MNETPGPPPSDRVMSAPDDTGRFGRFGGRFVPETLMPAVLELEEAFVEAWADDSFRAELDHLLRTYSGRPTPLTECHRLSEELGVRVLLKREDLNHTGSHKINNVLGQALLARRMGKSRLVAETGAGQHGVATATAAALLGQECRVYMGEVDMARQELNVFRMRLLGAEVIPALSGSRTLKDAVNDAMRDWVASVEDSYYCLGSVMGPHPYPWMVHAVPSGHRRRGRRTGTRSRWSARCPMWSSPAWGRIERRRDLLGVREEPSVELVGVEPAGGAAVGHGVPGIVHGMMSYLLQDEWGQVTEAESISRASTTRGRSRTQPPVRYGAGDLPVGDRRRGGGCLRAPQPHRGHHPGAGSRPMPWPGWHGSGSPWPVAPCW
ncbi:MAG: pyridoxal-phosphate dependent enzyme [Microthrixaceae bacterium]